MADTITLCSRCIMPANYPKITFDEGGICNYCSRWDKQWSVAPEVENDKNLQHIIDSIRNPSSQFDCLSGLSGGKDSCYAIYLCKKYGLRQLAVTFDNGFLSEEAIGNIKAITKRFSVGYVTFGLGWDEMKKLYRHCLINTGEFCSVCNLGIRAALYRSAELFKINTIIAGTSPRTEADVPEEFSSTSAGYFKNVFRSLLTRQEINRFLYVGQLKRGLWHLSGKLKWVQLPRYVPWKEEQILSILCQEAGWKGALWHQHADCCMSDAKEYLNLKRFGCIEKVAKLSALIRDQQMSREKAMELIEQEEAIFHSNEKPIQEKISATFELTKDDMNAVLQKKHLAYLPNSNDLYEKLKMMLYK